MVGDNSSDIAAGRGAGCKTILLERHSALSDKKSNYQPPDFVVADLREAALVILSTL
jgi:phosphoglycolate phosphatase-like HAD superfamily hydrolase